MKNVAVVVTMLFLSCSLLVGQTNPGGRMDEGKVYGGYQYTAIDTHAIQDTLNLQHVIDPTFPLLNFGNHQNLHGWNFGAQEDIAKWFGVVVDLPPIFSPGIMRLSPGLGFRTLPL
jgi:hypothetical protein